MYILIFLPCRWKEYTLYTIPRLAMSKLLKEQSLHIFFVPNYFVNEIMGFAAECTQHFRHIIHLHAFVFVS